MVQPIHRPDLESFTGQNPSGVFEDSYMPPLRMIILGDSTVTSLEPGIEPEPQRAVSTFRAIEEGGDQ